MASNSDMSVATILAVLVVMNFAGLGAADMEKDRNQCGSQLEALLPCLAYAQGQQKSPPLDCCTGLKQVLQKSKVCLCVLIKDRNSLGPGLELNATLALGLPTRCNAPSEVDQCPSLLQLKPGSPDAKIFEDFAKNNNGSISTPTGKFVILLLVFTRL
ncbi:hypothetical protein DCAR_0102031 [Daucus carota subsp. sativus]|uniref:Bifunctional inhibitor/plant lipid transfer protein/seed storage helical domain-containing protein n=1 Tax=Daucus carota subsp. sativus TaxID=79200 RepID=A0AAF1AJM1_DAUCS|nr:hypothetical protein DCAR_0102031 [Daucus carota subsp. sativus]